MHRKLEHVVLKSYLREIPQVRGGVWGVCRVGYEKLQSLLSQLVIMVEHVPLIQKLDIWAFRV